MTVSRRLETQDDVFSLMYNFVSLTFQNIYVLNVFGFLIENRVVGILNPKVMDNRNGSGGSSKNEVSFSIDHPDKIMELGDSVDVSRCQAKKNDGSGCTNLVKI